MSLATIINMIVFVCVPAWGPWAAILAWALWWVDVVLAIATNFYMPFIVMYKHKVIFPTALYYCLWLENLKILK